MCGISSSPPQPPLLPSHHLPAQVWGQGRQGPSLLAPAQASAATQTKHGMCLMREFQQVRAWCSCSSCSTGLVLGGQHWAVAVALFSVPPYPAHTQLVVAHSRCMFQPAAHPRLVRLQGPAQVAQEMQAWLTPAFWGFCTSQIICSACAQRNIPNQKSEKNVECPSCCCSLPCILLLHHALHSASSHHALCCGFSVLSGLQFPCPAIHGACCWRGEQPEPWMSLPGLVSVCGGGGWSRGGDEMVWSGGAGAADLRVC